MRPPQAMGCGASKAKGKDYVIEPQGASRALYARVHSIRVRSFPPGHAVRCRQAHFPSRAESKTKTAPRRVERESNPNRSTSLLVILLTVLPRHPSPTPRRSETNADDTAEPPQADDARTPGGATAEAKLKPALKLKLALQTPQVPPHEPREGTSDSGGGGARGQPLRTPRTPHSARSDRSGSLRSDDASCYDDDDGDDEYRHGLHRAVDEGTGGKITPTRWTPSRGSGWETPWGGPSSGERTPGYYTPSGQFRAFGDGHGGTRDVWDADDGSRRGGRARMGGLFHARGFTAGTPVHPARRGRQGGGLPRALSYHDLPVNVLPPPATPPHWADGSRSKAHGGGVTPGRERGNGGRGRSIATPREGGTGGGRSDGGGDGLDDDAGPGYYPPTSPFHNKYDLPPPDSDAWADKMEEAAEAAASRDMRESEGAFFQRAIGPAFTPQHPSAAFPPMSPSHPQSPSHPHFGSSPSRSPARLRVMGKARSKSLGAISGSATPNRTPTRSGMESARERRRGSLGGGGLGSNEYEWSVSPSVSIPLDLRDSPTYSPQTPARERNLRRQSRKASGAHFELPNDVDGLHLASPHRYRDGMDASVAAAAAVAMNRWPDDDWGSAEGSGGGGVTPFGEGRAPGQPAGIRAELPGQGQRRRVPRVRGIAMG